MDRADAIKLRKREYMAERYKDPEFAARKRAAMLARYHERCPTARYGTRGRRPSASEAPSSLLAVP
jgi:hypothetical protein